MRTDKTQQTRRHKPKQKILQILVCSVSLLSTRGISLSQKKMGMAATAAIRLGKKKGGGGCSVNVFALRDDPSVFGSWARLDHMI